ncbi:MAG: 16S rRNA (guanine(527)-N(7))-methyltransferase RsmG [Bacillota bacterium]
MRRSELEQEVLVSRGMLAFVGSVNAMRLTVSKAALEGVKDWLEFYYSWTGRRVVGFVEPELIAAKLLADSFSYEKVDGILQCKMALDLGSGNGWPGLALRFGVPDCEVALLDSREGSCDFMRGFVSQQALSGVRVIQARAEDVGNEPEFSEISDVLVSRAMAKPSVALELASPFVKIGGAVVLWLGPEQEDLVLKAPSVKELGISLCDIQRYWLPSGLGRRMLVVYRKVKRAEAGFPRRISSIRKKPLF